MFRLLGLLGGLAAVTDLGTGSATDESLRRCVVGARLARTAGCDDDEVREVLYVSLLEHIGCTAYSYESARLWGDDIAATRFAFLTDTEDLRDVMRVWVPGMAEATGRSKLGMLATTVRSIREANAHGPVATCEVATEASRRLGLPEPVRQGLHDVLTMWNGKGYPGRAGAEIPLATRMMHVASVATIFLLHAGPAVAMDEVRRRSGSYLDPDLAELFSARSADILGGAGELDAYEAALECEPDPVRLVSDRDLDEVAKTFGDLVDLKNPWLHGHSAAVAELAASAIQGLGLDDEVAAVRVAGHLHDVGRAAVSSRIWAKAEPLTTTERDQAHLHAYHSERVLARVPALADAARLAGQHHERCDGSGYHRGLTGDRMSMGSRVLAAADAYRSLVEDRPGSAPLPADVAASRLRSEARSGHLDGDAVEAVLGAAGHTRRARRTRPAGLTNRQVEVLRLMAAGWSNKDIAERLVISPRTAEHHVQDVYTKIGASTRAAAALFAMEHGLVSET